MPELIENGSMNEEDFYGDISPTAIALFDGHLFDILDPDTWIFNVDVIAQALSNICRFGGHCFFYPVAEHSVRVSEILEAWGEPYRVQYLGLHHDDIEAYLGDCPSPHKRVMSIDGEPFKSLEDSIEYAYFATLGLLTDTFEEDWARVKDADLAAYILERNERPHIGKGLTPAQAKDEYLARHRSLAFMFIDDVPRIS